MNPLTGFMMGVNLTPLPRTVHIMSWNYIFLFHTHKHLFFPKGHLIGKTRLPNSSFLLYRKHVFSHITSWAPVATRQTSNTDLSAVKVKSSRILGSIPAWLQSWYSHLTHVFLPFFFFFNDQRSLRIWKVKEQAEFITVSPALLGTLVKYVAFSWRDSSQGFKALSW